MRYGYWTPVFGGWLRNVEDEGMAASWDYVSRLAKRSEEIGYDLTLIAELLLNDVKGPAAPTLDAWSLAAAMAAVTERLELMVAVRPTFHHPGSFAKQAATIDQISNGRLALNVVSSWWEDEAKQFGFNFDRHNDRYARTRDWLAVVDKLWKEDRVDHSGTHYTLNDALVSPKPKRDPRPVIYAGGESDAAKSTITELCDAYVMHGDPVEVIKEKIAGMRERREKLGLPDMTYGMAAYAIVRDTEEEAQAEYARITNFDETKAGFGNYDQWLKGTELERQMMIEEYSVTNRGLRPGFVGTPEQLKEKIAAYEEAGLDLLLLQMSPQYEEMERFAESVIH